MMRWRSLLVGAIALVVAAILLGVAEKRSRKEPSLVAQDPSTSRHDDDGASSRAPTGAPDSDPPLLRKKPIPRDAETPPPDVDAIACQRSILSDFPAIRREIDPRASPKDAIAHALLMPQASANDAERAVQAISRLLGEASRRWPADREVAWLHAVECESHSGCDRARALAHLVEVDAGNAAVWLQMAGDARRRGDEAAESQALYRAAQAPFHDARSGLVYMRIRPMLAALTAPPNCLARLGSETGTQLDADEYRDMIAHAADSALAMPSYEGIAGCSPDHAPLSEARRRDCTIVLGRIADGESLLDQILGVSMLLRLNEGPFDQAALRERYRQVLWLRHAASGAASTPGFISRIWTEGEVNALRDIAIREGRWPPPDDWLPEDPAQRARILGRPGK